MVAQIDAWTPAMQWFFAAWMTFLGACFGSFMNVVVYRLPRGLSLVHPASHCPKCGHPIRPIDNVPVVSWLLLGGRCRDCRVRISARYPLVEAAVALLFLVVALVELQSNGRNLPATLHPPANTQWALWCNFAAQMLLLCTLVCVMLIEADGLRTPAVAYVPVLSVGLLVSCGVSGVPPILVTADPVRVSPWLTGLAGLATGGGLGVLMLPARSRITAGTMVTVLGPASCGAVLGWQGVAAAATFAALMQLAAAIVFRLGGRGSQLPGSTGLLVAALLLIVFWRVLAERWPRWLGEEASWPALISAAGAVLLASLVTRSIIRESRGTPQKDRSS